MIWNLKIILLNLLKIKIMNITSTSLFSVENLEVLRSLTKSNGNDADLGEKVRTLFKSDSFVKAIPNDYQLGEEVRKVVRVA